MAAPPAVSELQADVQRMLAGVHRRDQVERGAIGRRGRSLVRRRAGRYTRARRAQSRAVDLALDATLRAAAARTGVRRPLRIERDDLRRKVRDHRSPFAVALVVDNSYSLAAESMLEQVKGLALRILEEPAHRGDKVALVAFRGGVPEATVALPLTRSRRLARRRLEQMPLSGQTPLPDALRRGRRLLLQERVRHPDSVPLLLANRWKANGSAAWRRRPDGAHAHRSARAASSADRVRGRRRRRPGLARGCPSWGARTRARGGRGRDADCGARP